jgi:hypothetical protein
MKKVSTGTRSMAEGLQASPSSQHALMQEVWTVACGHTQLRTQGLDEVIKGFLPRKAKPREIQHSIYRKHTLISKQIVTYSHGRRWSTKIWARVYIGARVFSLLLHLLWFDNFGVTMRTLSGHRLHVIYVGKNPLRGSTEEVRVRSEYYSVHRTRTESIH